MTIPTAAAKEHLDSGTDDPKQARAELASLVDKFNTIRSHLLSSGITSGTNVLGIGTGLQSSGGNLAVNAGTGIGQIVQLEITEYPSGGRGAVGRVIEVLGDPTDATVDVEVVIREFELRHEFPEEVLEAAKSVPTSVSCSWPWAGPGSRSAARA